MQSGRIFKNAIVRTPGSNFADGLTTVNLGVPSYEDVLQQFLSYCEALKECGLVITTLEPHLRHPDSTFVEDTAVLTPRGAILGRPGAPSREGEATVIGEVLTRFFSAIAKIEPPGTLDGGDICEAGKHFFLGLSHRTNQQGVRQLAAHLARQGYTWSVIDVRPMSSILHLKSCISYIGNNTLVVMEEIAGNELFLNFKLIQVGTDESYAANCLRVNDRVLVAAGYPHLKQELIHRGFNPLVLDVSEFQKMDGGLSCLSLRF